MPSAHALRNQIEAALKDKMPAALSPAQRVVRFATPTGVSALDHVLGGGLPSAAITELVGSSCSGRTTAGLAYLSSLTRAGNVCAWIDVEDAFDPKSAAANGVDLERLLWVRCGKVQRQSSPKASQAGQSVSCSGKKSPAPPGPTGGGLHLHSEGHGMPQVMIATLHAHGLQDQQIRRKEKRIGTPGVPSRPISHRSEQREEQVNSDRLPARRGDNLTLAPRCAEPQGQHLASLSTVNRLATPDSPLREAFVSRKPLRALDHALRTTDLLLQAGGFGAIVLDLGGLPPEMAWRIPLATWFRFRAACERTRVSLLLLTQHTCARSSAELVVRMEAGAMEAESKVMTGIHYRAVVERSQTQEQDARVVPICKPPQSVRPGRWKSEAAWAQAR